MSSVVKKIKKETKRAFKGGSVLNRLSDPMDLFNFQKEQAAVEAAKKQEEFQLSEAARSTSSAHEQARAAALSMQTDIERQQALAEAEDGADIVGTPEVDLTQQTNEATERRKRFQSRGTKPAAGASTSIRL